MIYRYGFTGFSSGLVSNRTCYIPLDVIAQTSPRHLNPQGHTWDRVRHTCAGHISDELMEF